MRIFANQPLFLGKILVFLILCVVLMWLDGKDSTRFSGLRSASHVVLQPIYQLSSTPNFVSAWGVSTLESKESLRRENVKLKVELAQANAKLQQQDYLIAQNTRLQGILSVTDSKKHHLELAKVVGTDSNPTKQIVVLNRGSKQGVKVGQTVIDEKGIIGQIINVYANTSRLLLITDDTQSVAVIIERTGQRAVVSGKGTPNELSLDYIFKSSDVRLGDKLISSGLGGRVPAGYRVGRVTHIDTQQTDDNFIDIDVTPSANFIDNNYVLILQDKNEQNTKSKST
ncbi:MAG: rod shape-determining protein MreC [Moraxellaceae bacterium]|nr:rod shape-determining protein MreC [Moraxellaceae bacterium]